MDGDLAGIFTFVLIAAALVFIFASLTHRRSVKHEERKLVLQARIEEAKAAQAASPDLEKRAQIENRLRVLERIVTDPSADLATEIEALRDIRETREAVQ